MKVTFLLLLTFVFASSLSTQRCFNMSIASLMSKLEIPGSAAKNFEACNKTTNDHHQLVIADYGNYMKDLDTLVTQKQRDFNNAVIEASGSPASQMPSAQTIQDSKQLAEVLQSMTPEQQKEWAMQQANKRMQSSSHPPVMQDDPATTRLVMQTQDLAVNQLGTVDREFASKYRGIYGSKMDALQKLPGWNENKCPVVGLIGLRECSCVNKEAGKYWQKKVDIEDQYDAQIIILYQSYILKIKGLVEQVDHNIAKLHYGADVKSKQFQKMLFSSQSAAFGNAFDITNACIQDIHKGGADLYVKKVNCDKAVYELNCGE